MDVRDQKAQFGVNYNVGFDGFISRPADFISAGISWFERWETLPGVPPVSHAIKIVGPEVTIEALANGVVYGSLSKYLNDANCAVLVRKPKGWTPEMGVQLVKEAEFHLGEKYNYFLLFVMAIANSYVGKWIDKFTGTKFSGWLYHVADLKRHVICSQFCADVDNSIPELHGKSVLSRPLNTITPILLCQDPIIYEPGTIELLP
jgi:hypothetical protein